MHGFSSYVFCLFYFGFQRDNLSDIIHSTGCLEAGGKWLENNLIVVAGVAVGIAFLQVCFKFSLVLSSSIL